MTTIIYSYAIDYNTDNKSSTLLSLKTASVLLLTYKCLVYVFTDRSASEQDVTQDQSFMHG